MIRPHRKLARSLPRGPCSASASGGPATSAPKRHSADLRDASIVFLQPRTAAQHASKRVADRVRQLRDLQVSCFFAMPVQQPHHRAPFCERSEGPTILEDVVVSEERRLVKRIAHDADEHAKRASCSRLNHLNGCERPRQITEKRNERLD